ncbi:hypothetical protein DFQ28_011346 [Apophysomyces sp. BC1034]|nr:hypothetical protein DFQ30_003136 [Apophysomyces sp. BC1015]KAG0181207.1 hypothetical protein DFQ29_009078 [Apophysomyces sp. BC1021]KAG0191664.1 hypothetical protein DFQ28_011346 [Apophysomyces sp. BC1034]
MIVHPMHLVHGPEFKINLETDQLILRGSPEESAGVILRGSVSLDCKEHTKLKAVTLRFLGKTNVQWSDEVSGHQRHHKEERIIVEHEWSFLPPTRKTYQLAEGHYEWDFELPLPSDLPETVEHELGKVTYQLKAVAERPAFSINYVDRRPVQVMRLVLPSATELSQSVLISNVWTQKLIYDVSVPSRIYCPDSVIPVTFEFSPLASDIKIRSVACFLKEYTTFTTGDHHKTEGRVTKHLRDDHFPMPTTGVWTKTELLHIPSTASRHIKYDTNTGELIKIKHKLKFTVSLVNADGHVSELRAAIPIMIAAVAPEEDINALPAYEDAWKSVPYDPSILSELLASGGLTNASSQTNEDENGDTLPWMGMDLTRVPSYSTAMRSSRLHSFSGPSLPTYDSLTITGKVA